MPDEDERDLGRTAGYRAQSPSASPASHRRSANSPETTQLTGSPASHRRSANSPGNTQLTESPWRPESRPPSGTSGMAVAAFVLGLLGGVAILGVVFGIVALKRIATTHQGGKGLAVAGIVLNVAWVAVGVVAIVTGSVFGNPAPTSPGVAASLSAGASSQDVDPLTLTTGDCFNNPTPTAGQTQTVTAVVQTSCTGSHNAQVFATFTVSGSPLSYPGESKMHGLASSGCTSRVRTSLDGSKLTDSMSIRFLYPLQNSWRGGHRTISCIIYNPTPTLRSSLLKS
ncbi:MAG TPA: DUF4190 domain-containing protein [Streptosporangiaceae bacterium]